MLQIRQLVGPLIIRALQRLVMESLPQKLKVAQRLQLQHQTETRQQVV